MNLVQRRIAKILLAGTYFFGLLLTACHAQTAYEPTVESLNKHPLPQWYNDAKLGIFIHWGLYSVPGWAPLVHPEHDFGSPDYIVNNPYAEWYYNVVRIPGSPTQKYHAEQYGAGYDYYNFAATFNRDIQKWNPDEWAKLFHDIGAKYVVLTTKHHDGFTLWPSSTPNPRLAADRQHASRDLVGDLTKAVRGQGLKMGLYYSGGYDWTFVPGPIMKPADYKSVQPQSEEYGKYADAHMRELIQRYQPSLLWNDINYPKSGHPLEIMAEYYRAVPDGVINNRFGVPHSDFTTPEYQTESKISATKWEECRGLGRSFGYNRAEGEAETIAPGDLILLLADIVSKNGNLLLDIGPESDGTIPAVQMERLHALGDWLNINGEAIFGTRPWQRAEGKTADGSNVRFTKKGPAVYAIVFESPRTSKVTLESFAPPDGAKGELLGGAPVKWTQQAGNTTVDLPANLNRNYAFVLKFSR
jgi:alpha-L-fucosidase